MGALTVRDLKVVAGNDSPRILDLRLAERLEFERARDIRKLIERNRVELERYGKLICATVAQIGPGRPTEELLLNEAQALLVCMKSETSVAADVREEVITVYLAWRNSRNSEPYDMTSITDAILQPMQYGLDLIFGKLDRMHADITSRRKEIPTAVKSTHVLICHQLGGYCPCCSINRVTNPDGSRAPNAEFDHNRGSSAPTIECTWLICGQCHRKLTRGELLRSNCSNAFDLYQARRAARNVQKMSVTLTPSIETGPPSYRMVKQGKLF